MVSVCRILFDGTTRPDSVQIPIFASSPIHTEFSQSLHLVLVSLNILFHMKPIMYTEDISSDSLFAYRQMRMDTARACLTFVCDNVRVPRARSNSSANKLSDRSELSEFDMQSNRPEL